MIPRPDPAPAAFDVPLADGRIRVHSVGEGAPLLCLHGVSARGRSWMAVARLLAPVSRVWLPDLLGRGESARRSDVSYALAAELERLRELVPHLGGPPPVLVAGHSHGAALALAYARVEPAVRGVVLSNPVTPWTRRPLALSILSSRRIRAAVAGLAGLGRPLLARLVLARAAGPGFAVPNDAVEAYAEPYADRDGRLALLRALADWRPVELADHIPDRPLAGRILAGDHDPRITVRSAERLGQTLGLAVVRVRDGGHILPEQHPDLVAAEIRAVLREIGTLDDPC